MKIPTLAVLTVLLTTAAVLRSEEARVREVGVQEIRIIQAVEEVVALE